MKRLLLVAACILLPGFKLSAQNIIPAKYASKHIGQKVTICEMVYGSDHSSSQTLLYLGGDNPKQLLTVVIKTGSKTKFKGSPGTDFNGKDICLTGVVINNKGNAEIVVTDPGQIKPYLVDDPVKQKSTVQ
jgi:hypothetical protein